jgi:hypothetical protein
VTALRSSNLRKLTIHCVLRLIEGWEREFFANPRGWK